MRIAWVTLASNVSAGSPAPGSALDCLSAAAAVDVIRIGERDGLDPSSLANRRRSEGRVDSPFPASYDIVVYHFASSPDAEQAVMEAARRWPGFVLLEAEAWAEIGSNPSEQTRIADVTKGAVGVVANAEPTYESVLRNYAGPAALLLNATTHPVTASPRSDFYAQEFLAFLRSVLRRKPVLELTDRLAADYSKLGIDRDSLVVAELAEQLMILFGDCQSPR
ncbi:MAG: hypothetical protein ABI823_03130 [Bryobacteraceae bacterium]